MGENVDQKFPIGKEENSKFKISCLKAENCNLKTFFYFEKANLEDTK